MGLFPAGCILAILVFLLLSLLILCLHFLGTMALCRSVGASSVGLDWLGCWAGGQGPNQNPTRAGTSDHEMTDSVSPNAE